MLLSCHQMRAVEEAAFADGITAGALMEEAGAGIATAVSQFHPQPGVCRVHFGKGHNGGDALVAARHLANAGWQLELFPALPRTEWSPLTARQWEALPPAPQAAARPRPGLPLVLLDGLLGIGASGPLREPLRTAARAIHAARHSEGARVFALDIPSGLDADSGEAFPDAVCADCTLTVGFAKAGLLADRATVHVGRLAVIALRALSERVSRIVRDDALNGDVSGTAMLLRNSWPPRSYDLHKGGCGRVGIVAGSTGMSGAAVLAAGACVHAGAGLVTLFVPPEIVERAAAASAPEVMVRAWDSPGDILQMPLQMLAIGPGLGRLRDGAVLDLLRDCPLPMVVDADALNALATNPALLGAMRGPRLLTPHPGEMARLDPASATSLRRETLQRFVGRFPHVLLLKGSRTLVGSRGRPVFHNTTGNPGMACGGMGDVLTGVCAALAAQGASLHDAACLGAWLCGHAAELAVASGRHSEESLSASAVIAHLGPAFHGLRSGAF